MRVNPPPPSPPAGVVRFCEVGDLWEVIFLAPLWPSAQVALPGVVLVLEMLPEERVQGPLRVGVEGTSSLSRPLGGEGRGD